MKKFAFALAAVASFASAPAHATSFWNQDNGRPGCGGEGRCDSPLQGNLTYDGNGGTINDASFWTGKAGVFTSSIDVAENFSIADVNVSLNNLDHNNWGDLKISLSHGGNVVWLTSNQANGKAADGTFVFDDAASKLIGKSGGNWNPGTYRSADPLSVFNGLESAGLWTLKIYDTKANLFGGNGELCDWTLQLTPTPTSAVPEPATWAMMIAGFGMVGAQLRRRRATTVALVRA